VLLLAKFYEEAFFSQIITWN